MKFRQDNAAPAPAAELETDYRGAKDLGKIRIGSLGVYFPKLSGPVFKPWCDVERVWLRQEEVNANLCCGRGGFDQFFLMVQLTGGAVQKLHVQTKAQGKAGLERIAQVCPEVKIGVDRETTRDP